MSQSDAGAVFLLGTLVVAAGWGLGLALAISLASASVYVVLAVGRARRRVAEADALARQQGALQRIATLVARGAEPSAVYPVAVAELARVLDVEHVTLNEFDGADCVVLAAIDGTKPHVGERLSLDGDSVIARVHATGRPARIDDYAGPHSGVGAPVVVGGATRGALTVGSARTAPLPPETEERVAEVADLIGTAIGNAENRADLTASRARIVAANDAARRGIERDLHDGALQRIASLGLGLRTLEASIPLEHAPLRKQAENLVNGMADLYTELQDLSRGIHPATLCTGGLAPALKTLTRRSVVPVGLEVNVTGRLPDSIEAAAYFVAAEALDNAAKHAGASTVVVRATLDATHLVLVVSDDGSGGATIGGGLVGVRDRVEAVSGELAVASRTGVGTTVTARIPVPG